MGCSNSKQKHQTKNSNLKEAKMIDFPVTQASFTKTDQKQRAFTLKSQLYIEQNKIGSGSFADVYLYKNSSNSSLHALKILKDNTTTSAFLSEYQMLKDVESQFVIRIDEIIKIDDYLCIMMEYANQGTLDNFMQNISLQTVSINANQILDIVCDIFQGLDIVHSKKIIHRDLKMDNLLVSDYQIKIADLGVATYLISKSYAQTNIGNMLYAAPEKLNEKDNYNTSSDIFSAGLIVLQMILGLSSYEVLKLKINNNYTSQIQESPESLRNFIESVLNQNPEERPTANNAFNICRKLKYDQGVLNYINNKITGISLQLLKENNKIPPNIPFSLSINAFQNTAITSMNSTSNSVEEQLFEQGWQLYQKYQTEEAEKCFLKILEKNPVSVLALVGRLLCGYRFIEWINKKEYTNEWVKDQFKLISQLNPNHYIYYYCLGIINKDIDALNKCIELNPSMVEAIAFKGTILVDQKKIEEAIKLGQQTLEMNENNAFVLRILGFIYMKINRETSNKFFQRSLSINPNQYAVLYNLGNNFKNNNKIDKALEYQDQALSICPYFQYSIDQKFEIMTLHKMQYKEVVDKIENLFQDYGELEFLFFRLGYSYQLLGDQSKALYYYTKSLLYEENETAINNIGIIYKKQKEYKKAEEYYQKAIDKKYKLSFRNMFNLLTENLNQKERGKEYLKQLLELDFDINNEIDCTYKIEAHRLLEQYQEFLTFSEIALKKHPSSQEISNEILEQIKLDDFKEDLLAQFKLSEMIQNNQGVSLASIKGILKYLHSNNMNSLVVSHILKYINDAIPKQSSLLDYYNLLLDFKLYINQEILQNLYDSLKQLQKGNLNSLEYKIIFISLVNFNQLEFSDEIISEISKVESQVNKLFEKQDDQELITYLRLYYNMIKLDYFNNKNTFKQNLKIFEENKNIIGKQNISFKKRFKDCFLLFNHMISIYIQQEQNQKLINVHKQLNQKVINEGISLFPDLAEKLK